MYSVVMCRQLNLHCLISKLKDVAIRDGDDNINNLFTFCECHVTATCTVCMQFKIELHFSVFFCLSKFIAGNFRVLVEVLNRKINSFVAGMVNMLGSVAS